MSFMDYELERSNNKMELEEGSHVALTQGDNTEIIVGISSSIKTGAVNELILGVVSTVNLGYEMLYTQGPSKEVYATSRAEISQSTSNHAVGNYSIAAGAKDTVVLQSPNATLTTLIAVVVDVFGVSGLEVGDIALNSTWYYELTQQVIELAASLALQYKFYNMFHEETMVPTSTLVLGTSGINSKVVDSTQKVTMSINSAVTIPAVQGTNGAAAVAAVPGSMKLGVFDNATPTDKYSAITLLVNSINLSSFSGGDVYAPQVSMTPSGSSNNLALFLSKSTSVTAAINSIVLNNNGNVGINATQGTTTLQVGSTNANSSVTTTPSQLTLASKNGSASCQIAIKSSELTITSAGGVATFSSSGIKLSVSGNNVQVAPSQILVGSALTIMK